MESGEWVLHDTEVGMCSVTTALLEVRMQRGGGGGTPVETPGSSSYRRPLALVLLGLGSSSVLWHGVPVSL